MRFITKILLFYILSLYLIMLVNSLHSITHTGIQHKKHHISYRDHKKHTAIAVMPIHSLIIHHMGNPEVASIPLDGHFEEKDIQTHETHLANKINLKYESQEVSKKYTNFSSLAHGWHTVRVLVTAYLIIHNQDAPHYHCPVYNNLTASGKRVHLGIVATDTSVFPFGTKFIIPGYGSGVAEDRGGFINQKHIDLAFTSCKRALEWGARHMDIAYKEKGND